MKELKIQYERAAELVFKICYLILAFATFNPFIYASKVQPLFVKLTLVSGMLLMIIRLVKYKKYKKMPGLILMILFCLSFALSTFMNRQYGMIENGKWIIWTALQFFALYVCDVDRETKDYLKEFQIVSHIMIIYSMIASVISLKMLITSFSKIWQTVDGEFLVSGFIWGRLWGCYTDPNYGGAFAVVAIILSLVFFIKKKNLWRIVYVCSIVVNFLYLIFSDSRGGEIALACSLSIFLYFYLNRKLKDKKSVVRCGMIVMAILVINAGALVGIRVAKTEYNRQLAPVFAKMFSPKPMENTQKKQQVQQNVGRQQDMKKM